jgi:hypothetical protein
MISRSSKAIPLGFTSLVEQKDVRLPVDRDRDLSLYLRYGNKSGRGAVLVVEEKTNRCVLWR